MAHIVISLISGLIFGLGLTISGMINPEKVLGFLDIFGAWDPTLAFVMVGALIPMACAWRLVKKETFPLLDKNAKIPFRKEIDPKLIGGAIIFGLGWGLVGFCPGPALAALTIAGTPAILFCAAMIAGIFAYHYWMYIFR